MFSILPLLHSSRLRLLSCGYFPRGMIWLTCKPLQHAIERAHSAWLEGKIDKTGVMIHNVISEVDMGTPIVVREIPFVKGEDENLEHFEKKVHAVEWEVVIEGVKLTIDEIRKEKKHGSTEA